MRQQDAYLTIRPAYPRGCCPRAAKGDKTYLQPVFLIVIFGVDLLTFRPDIAYKRPNCKKKNKIVPVMFWPTVYKSQERYAGINGTVSQGRNTPLFLVFIVCRDSLSFLRYKEVNSKNCQKSSNKNCTSDALIHPVDSWGKIRQYKWHSCTGEIPVT